MNKRLLIALLAVFTTNLVAAPFGELMTELALAFARSQHSQDRGKTRLFDEFVKSFPLPELYHRDIGFLHHLSAEPTARFEIKFDESRPSFPGDHPLEVLQAIWIGGVLEVIVARHAKTHAQEEFLAALDSVMTLKIQRDLRAGTLARTHAQMDLFRDLVHAIVPDSDEEDGGRQVDFFF